MAINANANNLANQYRSANQIAMNNIHQQGLLGLGQSAQLMNQSMNQSYAPMAQLGANLSTSLLKSFGGIGGK